MSINTNKNKKQVDVIISEYKNHPSIQKIKGTVEIVEKNNFSEPTCEDIGVHLTWAQKGCCGKLQSCKILVETKEITGEYLANIYCNSIANGYFPIPLKRTDAIPLHKQSERTNAKHYCPISLLSCLKNI